MIIILTNDKKSSFYKNCGFEMVPKYEKKTKMDVSANSKKSMTQPAKNCPDFFIELKNGFSPQTLKTKSKGTPLTDQAPPYLDTNNQTMQKKGRGEGSETRSKKILRGGRLLFAFFNLINMLKLCVDL